MFTKDNAAFEKKKEKKESFVILVFDLITYQLSSVLTTADAQ